ALRAEIASRIGGHCFGEIPVIEIIGELGCGWIADIVHHDSTHPLQADEGIGAAKGLANRRALRFRPFGRAATLAGIGIMAHIKADRRKVILLDLLELISAIPEQAAGGVANRKRASTEA